MWTTVEFVGGFMQASASYAAVARTRDREMPVRVFLALFIALAAAALTRSPWPFAWLAVVIAYQFFDRGISRRIVRLGDVDIPAGLKAAHVGSTLFSSAIFAAMAPYMFLLGDMAGRWFAILMCCGGMLHLAMRTYASRWVLFAGAAPHAAALFGLMVGYGLTHGQSPAAIFIVVAGALVYVAHLVVGAKQSARAFHDLQVASIEANQAREAAEQANAAKSQFLATITHEIRTPMNAVLSAAHLLKRTSLTEEQTGHVAMLTNGGEVLMGLLNDVLDISKIEAGKMEIEEADLDLHEALDGLVALYRPRAEGNGVALVLEQAPDLPRRVRTDPLRLRQILFNLLSNAVKFTDQGRIALRARGQGDRLVFEVEDSGCGIDEAVMGRLFGAFEQANSATARSHGGTGLGLSIARRLAEIMGGSLTCVSAPGVGSIFRVELPLSEPQAAEAGLVAMGDDACALPALSILVAEDHDVNRRIVSLFLEPLGWRLTMAVNGAEAVDAAALERYDAILMDMQMPVMGGVEAGLAIRAGGGPNAGAPIVALTANAMGHHREAWNEVGVAAFLTKPIDPELLVSTLTRVAAARAEASLAAVA